jgi:hypothetical protein
MEWNTVYVTGKPDFEEDVVDNLKDAHFLFMEGTKEGDLTLFWIDEKATLRDFKKAIGSKTVFKYRLQFYTSQEQFEETFKKASDTNFTPQEQALIKKMIESRQGKVPLRRNTDVSVKNSDLNLLSA